MAKKLIFPRNNGHEKENLMTMNYRELENHQASVDLVSVLSYSNMVW